MPLDPTRYYLKTPAWQSDYQLDLIQSNAPPAPKSISDNIFNWLNNYGSCNAAQVCADPVAHPCEAPVPSGQQNIVNLQVMGSGNAELDNPPTWWQPASDGGTLDGKYLIKVPPGTPLVQVYFDVFCGAPGISDGNNMKFYPIPDWCKTEFGAIQRGWPATLNPAVDKKIPPRCPDPTWPLMRQYSDRHMALYQEDKSNLYELINVGYKPDPNNPNLGTWHAGSGALFQPSTLAGLHLHQPPDPPWGGPTMCYMPISGGMVMLQELLDALANGQPLTHGFRAVFRATSDGTTYPQWVYPAGNTQSDYVCRMAMPAGARFRLKGGPVRPDPVVDAKVAAYPPIVRLILKACQRYGVIHTDVGFADFGIEAAYDPRCDDVLPGTEGIPYSNYNPARLNETTLGIGHGLLVDLRYGPSGYNNQNQYIIRNSDWELIQFGWKG